MNCPIYKFEINDNLKKSYCKNCVDKCEYYQPKRYDSKVDPFLLAKLLKEKNNKKEEVIDNNIKEDNANDIFKNVIWLENTDDY